MPNRVNKSQVEKIKELYSNGSTYAQIAKQLGIRQSAVYYHASKGVKTQSPAYTFIYDIVQSNLTAKTKTSILLKHAKSL